VFLAAFLHSKNTFSKETPTFCELEEQIVTNVKEMGHYVFGCFPRPK